MGLIGSNSSSDADDTSEGATITLTNPIGDVVQFEDDADRTRFIALPTDESVLQDALDAFKEDEDAQRIIQHELGEVDDIRSHLESPRNLVAEFDEALTAVFDEVIPVLRNQHTHEFNGDVRQVGETNIENDGELNDVFAYILADFDSGAIVGGASNIIRNICHHLGYTAVEREYIRLVYRESIRASDLDSIQSHTIINDVIFMWAPEGSEVAFPEADDADEEVDDVDGAPEEDDRQEADGEGETSDDEEAGAPTDNNSADEVNEAEDAEPFTMNDEEAADEPESEGEKADAVSSETDAGIDGLDIDSLDED